MSDLTDTLAAERAWLNKGLLPNVDLHRKLLSAVENVLALCDDPYIVEFGPDEDTRDGILVSHVRKALTDALGGDTDGK